MKFLTKPEKLFLKSFLQMRTPTYDKELNIIYEIEYYDTLALKILKECNNLGFCLEDLNKNSNKQIENYINKNDDKIHFIVSTLILEIAKKYYNDDGSLKEKYK